VPAGSGANAARAAPPPRAMAAATAPEATSVRSAWVGMRISGAGDARQFSSAPAARPRGGGARAGQSARRITSIVSRTSFASESVSGSVSSGEQRAVRVLEAHRAAAGQQPVQVDVALVGDAQQVLLRGGIAPLGVAHRVLVDAERRGEHLLALGAADEAQPLAERHGGPGRGRRPGDLVSEVVCCIFVTPASPAGIFRLRGDAPRPYYRVIRSHVD